MPLEQVKSNFNAYGLLDDQVIFVPGFFKDTMPTISVNRLSILRLDGDMYESTIQVLDTLYDRVSIGGYIIIEDYHPMFGAFDAVNDFRRARSITDPVMRVEDFSCIYWKKTA